MFFTKEIKQREIKKIDNTKYGVNSSYGRSITSIQTAKDELFKAHLEYNPLDFINSKAQFFGLELGTKTPIYLSFNDSTHLLYVGPTRSAKGVALAHRAVETLRLKKGLIIIDPKKDDFLAQVILEELARQNRPNDMLVASFPLNFSYSGFDFNDTPLEFANKLIVALNLTPTGEAATDYYRRNERTILKKVLLYFQNSKSFLNVEFELNYKSLANFLKYLTDDLISTQNYNSEFSKSKPNFESLEKFSKRFFESKSFEKLDLSFDDIPILKGLHQTISELCDANIYSKINICDALHHGKIIYIQADQLDESSLKMLKILQVDILQKSKKKNANCVVIADEVSFYATKVLADSLSTIAGFGVQYILALQDLAQLNDPLIKNPILSNCQTKLFYKSSDLETLNYIEKISGKELVSQITKNNLDVSIKQTQEDFLNITRLRALKRDRVSVLICEALPAPLICQVWHIVVKEKFDWSLYDVEKFKPIISVLKKDFSFSFLEKKNEENDKTELKNEVEL